MECHVARAEHLDWGPAKAGNRDEAKTPQVAAEA